MVGIIVVMIIVVGAMVRVLRLSAVGRGTSWLGTSWGTFGKRLRW